jgi:uncharacterized protein with HEPN domain
MRPKRPEFGIHWTRAPQPEIIWLSDSALVVGEALNEVPGQILTQNSSVPCRQIIALRHRLVHGYWLVDNEMIMNIAQNETKAVVDALDQLIEQSES